MIEFHFNKDFWFEGRFYILLLMLFLGVIEPHAGLNVPNLIYFGCVLFLLILQIFVPIIHHIQWAAIIFTGNSIMFQKSISLSF